MLPCSRQSIPFKESACPCLMLRCVFDESVFAFEKLSPYLWKYAGDKNVYSNGSNNRAICAPKIIELARRPLIACFFISPICFNWITVFSARTGYKWNIYCDSLARALECGWGAWAWSIDHTIGFICVEEDQNEARQLSTYLLIYHNVSGIRQIILRNRCGTGRA